MSRTSASTSPRDGGLTTLPSSLFQCPSGAPGGFLGEPVELRALAGVIVNADAETRGVIEASRSASTRGWVAEYGWHSCSSGITPRGRSHSVGPTR